MSIEGFKKEILNAVEVVKVNEQKMLEVSGKKVATKSGIVILALPVMINVILAAFMFPNGVSSIFSRFVFWPLVLPVCSYVVSLFVLSFVVRKYFGGKGGDQGFFRIMSYGAIVFWVSVLPYVFAFLNLVDFHFLFNNLIFIASLWLLYVIYRVLRIYHGVRKNDAIIAIVIMIVVELILQSVLGSLFVGSSYRFLM